jgi:hypothetical protein
VFSSLNACTTWECVNSFAAWLAAIGTILISGLALWLSWRDQLIRVKASFDYGLVPGDDPQVLNREVYILEFANIGRRSVTVTNYEWRIRRWPLIWKYKRWVTFPQLESGLGSLCSRFPVELQDGKAGHIFHKASFFNELDDKESHLFASSSLFAFVRIFDFKIVLRTTTGKDINVDIPFRVRKNIWHRYRKTKT